MEALVFFLFLFACFYPTEYILSLCPRLVALCLDDGCPVSMILKALPFLSGGIKDTVVLPHHFRVCTKQSLQDLGLLEILGIMHGVG